MAFLSRGEIPRILGRHIYFEYNPFYLVGYVYPITSSLLKLPYVSLINHTPPLPITSKEMNGQES